MDCLAFQKEPLARGHVQNHTLGNLGAVCSQEAQITLWQARKLWLNPLGCSSAGMQSWEVVRMKEGEGSGTHGLVGGQVRERAPQVGPVAQEQPGHGADGVVHAAVGGLVGRDDVEARSHQVLDRPQEPARQCTSQGQLTLLGHVLGIQSGALTLFMTHF